MEYACYSCNKGGVVSKTADSHGSVSEPVHKCDKCDFKLFGSFYSEINIAKKGEYIYEYFHLILPNKNIVYIRQIPNDKFGITTEKAFLKKFFNNK